MLPRIWLGAPDGSMIRLRITQLFAPLLGVPCDWLKYSVVCLPTFIVCHVATAFCAVWSTSTVTWPLASTVCAGALALIHRFGLFLASALTPGATCKPPGVNPFGTFDAAAMPAAAAACCAAICCAMPCAACARFWIDGWLACKACCGDTPRFVMPDATAALRAAVICAPMLARFVAACTPIDALTDAPAASISAIAWQTGRSRNARCLDNASDELD